MSEKKTKTPLVDKNDQGRMPEDPRVNSEQLSGPGAKANLGAETSYPPSDFPDQNRFQHDPLKTPKKKR